METKTIKQSIQLVQHTIDKMVETVSGISEDTIRRKPSDDEWSIIQIICHVLEAIPYWMKDISQIKKYPEELWGRNHLQEARLAAIEKTDNRTIDEVLKELIALKTQVEMEFSTLDPGILAIESTSRNPNFGTKPISFIVDHLIVEHASKHYGQIKRNLSKLS
ncbi:putative damage-inducible protein DinB [Bacillus niacini]|uniref:Damage-inducible protein DinB n=1 Tax=Neobacillus niacini TaxID=86668 RepID=A0A852TAK7_9BACI|nr:DinB family protein [Neobacillus niacini]NYE04404.1 putative damage-inducible protein DinB [Neobacillus niacini]